ncbi:MAG TPA: glycosyltransferase [Solirubrobacteraceae bacterium]|nr:glycosyltransferase [Solirubrobacteraceae bacterium]
MTTVFLSGAVANKHRQGGSIWVRMSWADALRDAGLDVVFVEQIDERDCVDAAGAPARFEDSANAAAFEAAMAEFGLQGALVCPGPGDGHEGARVIGIGIEELFARAAGAALLVNVGGHLRWEPLVRRLSPRAFVDLDPGFTQIWHAEGRDVGVAGHDLHFTVGLNVGTPGCTLPTGGLRWRALRQPVALHRWAAAAGDELGRFTTVASWRGAYGPASWAGRSYGVKAHEFRRFLAVPGQVRDARFEVALDIQPGDRADIERLRAHGWKLSDPGALAAVSAFRGYVRASGAEFSPAQNIYVDTHCGWFSDRTVRYLACGRPALVQDTGFSEHLPTGEGLVAFRTVEEAVAGARALLADYPRHRAAARRIAAEHFAGARAIAPLLAAAGLAP